MKRLKDMVEIDLLPRLQIDSIDPYEPIRVKVLPEPWVLLGNGNYAAVVQHPEYNDVVVKIYAPGREGWEKEVGVYRKLGEHPAFSQCLFAEGPYLVLKKVSGVTLYDCLRKGIRVPEQVIRDIDEALVYARGRGLNPQDIHGKNVMMEQGRGKVLDVSDFLNEEGDRMWEDLKRAYYRLYVPFMSKRPVPVPDILLNSVRKGYRWFRHSSRSG